MKTLIVILTVLLTTETAHAYCSDPVPPYCPSGTVAVCSDQTPYPMIGKFVCVPIAR